MRLSTSVLRVTSRLVHRKGQMRHGTTHFNTEVMDKMTFDNAKLVECVEFHRHASSRITSKHRDDVGASEVVQTLRPRVRLAGAGLVGVGQFRDLVDMGDSGPSSCRLGE